MGRWRDAVRLCRNWKLNPRTIDELFIDQTSEIVGSDNNGNYRVASFEQDPPKIIKFSVVYDNITDFSNEGKMGDNLISSSAVVYYSFKDEVAKVLSRNRFAFNYFIQGEVIRNEGNKKIDFLVPITPIDILRKDYMYNPVGVTTFLALTHLYTDKSF